MRTTRTTCPIPASLGLVALLGCTGTHALAGDAGASDAAGRTPGPSALSARNIACVLEDGDVRCWASPDAPIAVEDVHDVVEIATTAGGLCVRLASGEVRCGAPDALVTIAPLEPTTQIASGTFRSCALSAAGRVACWGQAFVGDGVDARPVEVAGLDEVLEVSVGWDSACARRRDGTVWCWGRGEAGQLGDGALADRASPAPVPGLRDVVQIAVGASHACARLSDGTLRCWGRGPSLDGGENPIDATPVAIPELSGIVDVRAGYYTTFALGPSGAAWGWGIGDYGQLSDGTTLSHARPAPVVGVGPIRAIAAGHVATCFLSHAGEVSCAGYGFGTLPVTIVPVP